MMNRLTVLIVSFLASLMPSILLGQACQDADCEFVRGDLDCDGDVDYYDVQQLNDCYYSGGNECPQGNLDRADWDDDGDVDSADSATAWYWYYYGSAYNPAPPYTFYCTDPTSDTLRPLCGPTWAHGQTSNLPRGTAKMIMGNKVNWTNVTHGASGDGAWVVGSKEDMSCYWYYAMCYQYYAYEMPIDDPVEIRFGELNGLKNTMGSDWKIEWKFTSDFELVANDCCDHCSGGSGWYDACVRIYLGLGIPYLICELEGVEGDFRIGADINGYDEIFSGDNDDPNAHTWIGNMDDNKCECNAGGEGEYWMTAIDPDTDSQRASVDAGEYRSFYDIGGSGYECYELTEARQEELDYYLSGGVDTQLIGWSSTAIVNAFSPYVEDIDDKITIKAVRFEDFTAIGDFGATETHYPIYKDFEFTHEVVTNILRINAGECD